MSSKPRPDRLESARLYLILSRDLCRLDPLDTLRAALDGGVDLVQLREKQLEDREFLSWIRQVHEITAPRMIPLLINDRVDLAMLTGVEGVHLGQADLPPEAARQLWGEAPLIGLSTHDADQVRSAAKEPVDYLGLGPYFDTATKALQGRSMAELSEALILAEQPVFGIGGLSPSTLPQATASGLGRAAVCAAICDSSDPSEAASTLKRLL